MSILETKAAACRVQFKARASEGIVEGYGATWDLDLGGDRFEPGAFRGVIADDYPAGRVKVYRRHDVSVGLPMDLKEDSTGLWVSAKIRPGDSRDGDETLNLADSGVYDSFSVAFVPDPQRTTYKSENGRRVRVIGNVLRLPHVGILDDPMNPAATIHAVKGQLPLVDTEKKSLYLLAEAIEHLAIVEDIRRFGRLNEEEAAVARKILRQMREAGAALEGAIPIETIELDDDLAGLLDAAKALRTTYERT